MRRKLSSRTLVVTINRPHVNIGRATTSQSLLLLLARATHIFFFLCAHPVRDESHNQRNTTIEVATQCYLADWLKAAAIDTPLDLEI